VLMLVPFHGWRIMSSPVVFKPPLQMFSAPSFLLAFDHILLVS
jgi:hypothetical protein